MELQVHQRSLTHHELSSAMKESSFPFTDFKNQQKLLEDLVISTFQLEGRISVEELEELQKKVSSFLAHAVQRYKKDSRNFDVFIRNPKNADFLAKTFCLPESLLVVGQQETQEESPEKTATASKRPKFGRKPVPFEEKSRRAQQYASARVRELHEPGAIVLAASQQQSPLGQLVKKTKSPSGRTAGLALKAIKSSSSPGIQDSLKL